MPSLADRRFRRFAAPFLVEQFAEREPDGKFAEVVCTLPSNEAVKLAGVIVGALAVESVEAESGTLVRRETVTIHIPKDDNTKLTGILQKTRFEIPKFGERKFVPQQIGSTERGQFLDYALERKPLARMDDKTSNGSAV